MTTAYLYRPLKLSTGPLPKHPYSRDNRPGMIAPDFDIEEVDMVFLEKSLKFLDEHKKQKPESLFSFSLPAGSSLAFFPGKGF